MWGKEMSRIAPTKKGVAPSYNLDGPRVLNDSRPPECSVPDKSGGRRGGALASILVLAVVALVILSPLASATTLTAPYKNSWYGTSVSRTGTGANAFQLPNSHSGTGVSTYWHNSTAGQSPGVGSFDIRVGFNTTNFTAAASGNHWVNSTWYLHGYLVFGWKCINTPGAGISKLTLQLEENVFDWTTHKWLTPTNVSVSVYTNSSSYDCRFQPSKVTVLFVNASSMIAATFGLSANSVYSVWTDVQTLTYADETGVTDSTVFSCVDFALIGLPTPSCSGRTAPNGEVELQSVSIVP